MRFNFQILARRPGATRVPAPVEQSQSPAPKQSNPQAQQWAELRNRASETFTEILAHFFPAAGSALVERMHSAKSTGEQELYCELSRWLPLEQARLARALTQELDRRLRGVPPETEEITRWNAPAQSMDDVIALKSMQQCFEILHGERSASLKQALGKLQNELGESMDPTALSAAGLCSLFQAGVESTGLASSLRRVLYGLVERFAAPQLDRLFDAVERVLASPQPGPAAAKPAAAPAPWPEEAAAARPAPVPAPAAAPVPTPKATPVLPQTLDTATLRLLQQLARPAGFQYDDRALGQDLLRIAEGKAPQGLLPEKLWVPLQRMVLAGSVLNQFLADPHLPVPLRAGFERLRLPLLKTTLTDAGFFTTATHPVLVLVNELASMAAIAHISGAKALAQMEQLLGEVAVQFDLSPVFVRDALPEVYAIYPSDIERFQAQQRERASVRRQNTVAKAKRIVAAEMETRTLGRDVPPAAQPFLQLGWAPLLAKRLLRHGMESAPWRQALAQLEEILDALDARSALPAATGAYEELVDTTCAGLLVEGLGAQKLQEVRESMHAAWREPRKRVMQGRIESRRMPGVDEDESEIAQAITAAPAPAEPKPVTATIRRPATARPAPAIASNRAPTWPEQAESTIQAPTTAVAPEVLMPSSHVAVAPTPAPAAAAPVPPAEPVVVAPAVTAVESLETLADLPAAPPAGGPADPLSAIFTPGSWFRVYDAEAQTTRWLKFSAYLPHLNSVVFAEFDGDKKLRASVERFSEDLAAGRSEPINATPEVRGALQSFLARRKEARVLH